MQWNSHLLNSTDCGMCKRKYQYAVNIVLSIMAVYTDRAIEFHPDTNIIVVYRMHSVTVSEVGLQNFGGG